jgi:hypothetical protein
MGVRIASEIETQDSGKSFATAEETAKREDPATFERIDLAKLGRNVLRPYMSLANYS